MIKKLRSLINMTEDALYQNDLNSMDKNYRKLYEVFMNLNLDDKSIRLDTYSGRLRIYNSRGYYIEVDFIDNFYRTMLLFYYDNEDNFVSKCVLSQQSESILYRKAFEKYKEIEECRKSSLSDLDNF